MRKIYENFNKKKLKKNWRHGENLYINKPQTITAPPHIEETVLKIMRPENGGNGPRWQDEWNIWKNHQNNGEKN